jgi:aspartyl-tRNA(Asn)/glutamyl-tRNA(Gln) amidotransferase subunit A
LENFRTYSSLRQALDQGRISCRQIVEFYLARIEEHSGLNAFLEVYSEEALLQADAVDKKINDGEAGELAGMVVGLKDVICHKDHGLQASSKILEGFKSQFTSPAVQSLIDADAIIIGRQNCDEFAMGSSNENSAFGPVKNGLDTERVPGGSSGGSAVAVQMNLCQVSLGSDTGGSVRQPAAFCGVVGLKPTYSRISRYGLIAYASSFDTIGIISKSVEDAALVLEYLAGADGMDSTASQEKVPSYSRELSISGKKKIGLLRSAMNSEGVQAEVKEKTLELCDYLKSEGHEIIDLEAPFLDYALPTYYILTTAEASTNLSRYDGVRYGYRSPNGDNLEDMYKNTRTEGFGEEVKRRIMLGTFVLSAKYHDAYFTKAQRVRRRIKEFLENQLKEVDFIINPTTPETAFKLGEKTDDVLSLYLADLFTVQASVAGLPAISIPVGKDNKGMPIGVQIMGNAFNETQLLAFSNYIETGLNESIVK